MTDVKEKKLDLSGVLFKRAKILAKISIKQEEINKEYHTHEEKDYLGVTTKA